VEIVGNEVYEAENPKAIREARDFSRVRFTLGGAEHITPDMFEIN